MGGERVTRRTCPIGHVQSVASARHMVVVGQRRDETPENERLPLAFRGSLTVGGWLKWPPPKKVFQDTTNTPIRRVCRVWVKGRAPSTKNTPTWACFSRSAVEGTTRHVTHAVSACVTCLVKGRAEEGTTRHVKHADTACVTCLVKGKASGGHHQTRKTRRYGVFYVSGEGEGQWRVLPDT